MLKNNVKVKENKILIQNKHEIDYKLSMVVVLVLFSVFLLNVFDGIAYVFNLDTEKFSIGIKGILGFVILVNIRSLYRRLNLTIIMIILITIITILINFLFFPNNATYFSKYAIDFVFMILPVIIYLAAIRDYNLLYRLLLKISNAISIITIMFFVISVMNNSFEFNSGEYSMGLSYALLIPTLVISRDVIENRKITSIIKFIFLVVVMLAYGSRGAIISVAIYLVLETTRGLIFDEGNNYLKIIIPMLVLPMIAFFRQVLIAINTILMKLGITSRTLILFLSDNLGESIGRKYIYDIVWTAFKSDPISVKGINAEFLLGVGYAHNIFLELLYQFGVVLGIPIILIIAYYSFKTIVVFGQEKGKIIRILFSASIPPLMISQTLWGHMPFWMWLIFCVSLSSKRNHFRKEISSEITTK